jgi:hypothetical protein
MSNPKQLSKTVQKMADQIWDSLAAYARTLVWVPIPPPEEDDDGS